MTHHTKQVSKILDASAVNGEEGFCGVNMMMSMHKYSKTDEIQDNT